MSGPPDRPEPGIAERPPELDLDTQRMRASLRAKMFGITSGAMQIGRFAVIEPLGRGGTGIVYAAHDARLDRKVAVKVLADASEEGSAQRQRIAREAQVLATLSHPNVVQIFEVGSFEGRVFLAMEYVDGTTIAQWQRAEPRSWREIVEKYAQAGAGLAAAHREGIVHRDVKPANLLLGADGRVRVVDFGLARPLHEDAELDGSRDTGSSADASAELELTQTADLMGTPAYMAPEQFARQQPDPRSDQFSFCVSLYEGLFGARPYPGRTSAEVLLAIVEGGRVVAPRTRGVPRRIRVAIERGLSREPADRFPDMAALLAELQPARVFPGLLPATLVAVVIGVGATWIYSDASPCMDSAPALAGVWDDARGDAIGDAFTATGVAAAADAEREVGLALDGYAHAWVDAREQACAGGPELLDRRMACLDRRRRALDALARQLVAADPDAVHNAVDAAHQLPRIDACTDDEALRSSVPAPPAELVAEVAAVRAQLDEARAQSILGHYRDGVQLAERAVERARAIDHAPILAEATLELGRALARLDRGQDARVALLEAADLAESNRHDEAAADACIELVYVTGALLLDRDAALVAARRADAAVLRLDDDAIRRAELLRDLGLTHYFAGDVAQARPAFERALELQRRELGDDDLEVARTLSNYADALAWGGEVEQALPHFAEAHAAFVARVGAKHPRVGMVLFVHGLALQSIARYDEARAKLDAALEVYADAFGDRSAKVAAALEAVAKLELERERFAAGLEPAREALRLRTELSADGSERDRLTALVLVAELEHAAGQPQAAIEPYRQALALLGDDVADAEQRVLVQTNLALALHEADRSADAIPAFEQALRWFAEPGLATHPAREQAAVGLADALVAVDRPGDAVAQVQRVMAELATARGPDRALAQWIEQHPQLVR